MNNQPQGEQTKKQKNNTSQIMLNFAEQTGSGAVMIVWSFLTLLLTLLYLNISHTTTIHPNFNCVALTYSYPSQRGKYKLLMLME